MKSIENEKKFLKERKWDALKQKMKDQFNSKKLANAKKSPKHSGIRLKASAGRGNGGRRRVGRRMKKAGSSNKQSGNASGRTPDEGGNNEQAKEIQQLPKLRKVKKPVEKAEVHKAERAHYCKKWEDNAENLELPEAMNGHIRFIITYACKFAGIQFDETGMDMSFDVYQRTNARKGTSWSGKQTWGTSRRSSRGSFIQTSYANEPALDCPPITITGMTYNVKAMPYVSFLQAQWYIDRALNCEVKKAKSDSAEDNIDDEESPRKCFIELVGYAKKLLKEVVEIDPTYNKASELLTVCQQAYSIATAEECPEVDVALGRHLHTQSGKDSMARLLAIAAQARKYEAKKAVDILKTSLQLNYFNVISYILQKHPKVQNFSLERCNLAGSARAIKGIFKGVIDFTYLRLAACVLDDAAIISILSGIQANNTLTEVNLEYSQFGDDGASGLGDALKSNSTLKLVNLKASKINDGGAQGLGECLKINNTLTELNLRGNRIGDQGADTLAEGLNSNSSLVVLNLRQNIIGNDGACSLGKALEVNATLQEINLWNNNIADVGICALAGGLKINSSLTTLHLSNNMVANEGASALAEALKYNSTLNTLTLSGTLNEDGEPAGTIGDGGAVVLAEGLTMNDSLTELNLAGNIIADTGPQALAKVLKCNSTLTKLDLSWNKIADAGACALGKELQSNKSLTSLNINWNSIGQEGSVIFKSVKKEKSGIQLQFERQWGDFVS